MSYAQPLGVYSPKERSMATKYLNLYYATPELFYEIIYNFTDLSLEAALGSRPHAHAQHFNLGSWALISYSDCRFIRPFNSAEIAAIKNALPSEQVLCNAINNITDFDYIFVKLQLKSLVMMLCEDFPHLEGLSYCRKMKEIDEYLEAASQMEVIPFKDCEDIYETRSKCHILGEIHPWWKIGNRQIDSINGIPIRKAAFYFHLKGGLA